MGEFFNRLDAAKDEFNVFDVVTVNAMMEHLFEPAADTERVRALWPDAEPMLEGAAIGLVLELAYDRESAAKGRNAQKATEFFGFVTDRLVEMIEQGAAEQGEVEQ